MREEEEEGINRKNVEKKIRKNEKKEAEVEERRQKKGRKEEKEKKIEYGRGRV